MTRPFWKPHHKPRRERGGLLRPRMVMLGLALLGMLGVVTALAAHLNVLAHIATPGGTNPMPQLTEAGQVETHADGSRTFTHGHRAPDNQQAITQEYDAQGRLTRAQVSWSGFAGRVLDVTATFGPDGKLLKEEGYRAPEMTTPITELLKPLPATSPAQAAAPAPKAAPDTAPVVVPSLAPAPVPNPVPNWATSAAPTPAALPAASAEASQDELVKIVEGLHTIYGAQPQNKK